MAGFGNRHCHSEGLVLGRQRPFAGSVKERPVSDITQMVVNVRNWGVSRRSRSPEPERQQSPVSSQKLPV
jgi:hypothetical protein